MKKLVIVLLLIGFAVFMTWDSEENRYKKKTMYSRLKRIFSPI